MGRARAARFGFVLVVLALTAGATIPASAGEQVAGVPETVTLSRWEYLDLAYKSMSCGMRCGSEPALLYCETHILRTADGGIAEFAYWWKTGGLSARDLQSKLTGVNTRLPSMFERSMPVVQGLWPPGPLEDRLLIVHISGETGEVIGISHGGTAAFEPAEIAAVDQRVRDRGTIPIY